MCFYVLSLLLQCDMKIAKGCLLPPVYFSKVFVLSRGFFPPLNFLPTWGPRLWGSALDTTQNRSWECAHFFKGGLKHTEQSLFSEVGGRRAAGWCLTSLSLASLMFGPCSSLSSSLKFLFGCSWELSSHRISVWTSIWISSFTFIVGGTF